MKVLVCGGRDYHDEPRIYRVLEEQHKVIAFTHLIHGDASGADRMAGDWARAHGVQTVVCAAQWENHGRGAGPIRNRRMLELAPDLVIAFPGGKGTENMVKLAQEANVQVYRVALSAGEKHGG